MTKIKIGSIQILYKNYCTEYPIQKSPINILGNSGSFQVP